MTDFSDHYDRVSSVYETLGEVDGNLCIGNHDYTGWYNNQATRARAWALSKEWPGIRQQLDRVVYATISYTPRDWFMDSWTRYEWTDDGREWQGEKPMPGYGEIGAFAPFADIDLADAAKESRPDGEIPREAIESALFMYADAFADLAGGMRHVFALDSVGGAYMMVAPSATKPIADRLDTEERRLLFEDMVARLNEWLDDVDSAVLAEHPELEGVFEADCVNNKNRLYKAPLSVHSSLDGVVTPVNPADPSYAYTPVSAVGSDEIARAEAWADAYTGDHTDAVGSLVATLWPDATEDTESWENAIAARVDALKETAETTAEREETRLSDAEIPDGLESTDDMEVIHATIEAIDVADLAREICDEWDTDPGRDPPRFAASWHTNLNSGTSCFADSDKFVDLKEGGNGGGALKLIARHTGIISHCRQSVSGTDSKGRKKFWMAVSELRKRGYDIPRFEGSDGRHPDALGLYDETDSKDEEREQFLKALKL